MQKQLPLTPATPKNRGVICTSPLGLIGKIGVFKPADFSTSRLKRDDSFVDGSFYFLCLSLSLLLFPCLRLFRLVAPAQTSIV